jgi:hypothetical protein
MICIVDSAAGRARFAEVLRRLMICQTVLRSCSATYALCLISSGILLYHSQDHSSLNSQLACSVCKIRSVVFGIENALLMSHSS